MKASLARLAARQRFQSIARVAITPIVTAIVATVAAVTPVGAAQEAKPAADGVSFTKDIAPILVQRCVACHGATKPKGNFNLSSFDSLAKGINNQPVFVAGKPDESLLVDCLAP